MKILGLIMTLLVSQGLFAADVDVSKSSFKWTGEGITKAHYGKLPLTSSKVRTDKSGKVIGGEFILDVANFTVEDLSGEWKQKFLAHMKSKDFFDVSKKGHDKAKLIIESLDGKMAKGKLTIMNKTQPITFKYKQDGKKYSGQLKFDRTKFGMIYGSGSFFKNLGDKAIKNDVKVDFSVVLK